MENLNGLMATFIKANFARTCAKDKVKCNGTTKAYTQVNGEEVFQTAKVLIPITKSGMFKAKDEKPRFGIFEDNILVKESKNKMYLSRNDLDHHSQTEILKIIPEVTRRKKSVFRKRNGKSVNPSSTNSTTMTFKIGKRPNNKSNYK